MINFMCMSTTRDYIPHVFNGLSMCWGQGRILGTPRGPSSSGFIISNLCCHFALRYCWKATKARRLTFRLNENSIPPSDAIWEIASTARYQMAPRHWALIGHRSAAMVVLSMAEQRKEAVTESDISERSTMGRKERRDLIPVYVSNCGPVCSAHLILAYKLSKIIW